MEKPIKYYQTAKELDFEQYPEQIGRKNVNALRGIDRTDLFLDKKVAVKYLKINFLYG